MTGRPPPHITGMLDLVIAVPLALLDWLHGRNWRLCRWLRERARRRVWRRARR